MHISALAFSDRPKPSTITGDVEVTATRVFGNCLVGMMLADIADHQWFPHQRTEETPEVRRRSTQSIPALTWFAPDSGKEWRPNPPQCLQTE